MSQNHETIRQWGKQLDAGQRDEPLLEVARRLQTLGARATTPRPPAGLKQQLRQQLLATYQPGWTVRLWRGASSAAAFGVLAVVVAAALWVVANNMNSTQPATGGQTGAITPEAQVSPESAFAPAYRLGARFGEAIELIGYDLTDDTLLPGEEIRLTLYWQTIAQPQADATLFVHLYDEDGLLVAQFDGPTDETRPTSAWQAGETISQPVVLPLPAENLAPGDYEMVIGLYLPGSEERLIVTQPEAQSTELALGSIFVEPAQIVQPDGLDHVIVTVVRPASGQVLRGTAPITFEITVDYELATLEEAVIQAAVVQQLADGGGRGVANTQATVQQGAGEVVLTAVLDPQRELNGSADLGLLVQMHHAERSAAVASEMPDAYHWRYEP